MRVIFAISICFFAGCAAVKKDEVKDVGYEAHIVCEGCEKCELIFQDKGRQSDDSTKVNIEERSAGDN